MKKTNAMNKKFQAEAINIMGKIMQHPISNFFNRKHNPQIPSQLDIERINKKLKKNTYKTIAEWTREVRSLETEAKTYFGISSIESQIAKQIIIMFEKEFEKFVSYSIVRWSRYFGVLHHKLQFQISKIPESLTADVAIANLWNKGIPNVPGLTSENKIPIYVSQEISDVDVSNFLLSIAELNEMSDVHKMVSIIMDMQPDLKFKGADPEIQIDCLKPETLRGLIAYSKQRFKEMKKQYPSKE
ncbi:Bromodomain containing protein [Histomonas meleagridis]|uniref:Bromodomain containing protein n=1 Tax=Histomonas meleagridis TaxID=135588 RepID=UPI00355A43E4|nr:Bromodomain containing protein [Histomonas meleagridis]KAH0805514.1 Bromodomain containing protein [Histomonas meleagridis]